MAAGAGVAALGGVDQRMTSWRRGVAFLQLRPAQEDTMSEMKMTSEAEVEDFTDELSDEALDRAEGALCGLSGGGSSCGTSAPSYLW